MPSPAQREAYAIEVRIQALVEARGIEEQYWPWYDDELRMQAEQERRHMAFKPEDHLIKLPRRAKNKDTGKWGIVYDDYLEVKHRLVWFRDRFPHGEIITEEVHVDLDRLVTVETTVYNEDTRQRETTTKTGMGYARFKTTARDGEGGVSTGHGTESAVEFADFVERAETRSIGRALAGLGIGTQFVGEELGERMTLAEATPGRPFVGSENTTGALKDVQDPVETRSRATGNASAPASKTPTTAKPTVQEPQEVLGRKPIEKLSQQECVFRLQDELRRLTGTEQDERAKSLRVSLLTSIFGTGIHSFALATGQGKSTLQRGLVKLEAMQPAVPPGGASTSQAESSSAPAEGCSAFFAGEGWCPLPKGHEMQGIAHRPPQTIEEGAPEFPPSDGNPQEGHSLPPGDTTSPPGDNGLTPAGKVASNEQQALCPSFQDATGIRCVREPRHKGNHYFPPPRPEERPAATAPEPIALPDKPTIVDGFVTVGDGHVLQVWAMMHGQSDTFAEMTESCLIDEGERCISLRLWDRIVAAVTFQVAHASRAEERV